jgi:hypothetical protein
MNVKMQKAGVKRHKKDKKTPSLRTWDIVPNSYRVLNVKAQSTGVKRNPHALTGHQPYKHVLFHSFCHKSRESLYGFYSSQM